jgi:hypothetical protein
MCKLYYSGIRMMHAGRCRTFQEELCIHCINGSVSQELHSGTIGCRQDSVQGLAWEEAIFEPSLYVRMPCICPHFETKMKEAR